MEVSSSEKLGPTLKCPKLNILILGETGVGKSTWVNAFYNFLSYSSLQEAEEGELQSIIPTSFTVLNEKLEIIKVTTGNDDNESFETGQSSTQGAKIHRLQVTDNCVVQLIDTPGIGDTRGLDQDQLNFQNIMKTVKGIGELHGICILLKPNNARLTLMLRFCILELIRHLDKSAAKNIVFCFTNSRETFYRPGDTLPALRSLFQDNNDAEITIAKDTVYCFDSEAFRYLAAIKNDPPLTFTEGQKQDFEQSWEKSLAETKRMLKYLQTLKPHSIKSTYDFSKTQDAVLELTRPIAESLLTLQLNQKQIDKELQRQSELEREIEDLKKRQITTKVGYERVMLKQKLLVCSHPKCIKDETPPGEDDNTIGYYKKICQSNCSIARIYRGTLRGLFRLYFCEMMNFFGRCRRCNHSYKKHFHVEYESRSITEQVEDPKVKASLVEKVAQKMKDDEILEKKRLLDEYSIELKEFITSAVKLETFVKKHSIITQYHDRMEQELKHLLQEEKEMLQSTDNVDASGETVKTSNNNVEALQEILKTYDEEKAAYETGVSKGENIVTSVETEEIINRLKTLKHSENAFSAENESITKF